MDTFHVFLSYAHQDIDAVTALHDRLKAAGLIVPVGQTVP
jgi:hypothetical protein